VSSVLDTVSLDAEIYFVVITMSHLLIVIMYGTTRVGFFAPSLEFYVC